MGRDEKGKKSIAQRDIDRAPPAEERSLNIRRLDDDLIRANFPSTRAPDANGNTRRRR